MVAVPIYHAIYHGFLSKLEKLLGRRVRPLPVGRPKNKQKSNKNVKMGCNNR